MLNSQAAYTQTNIDSLWSLLQHAGPIQENSAAWQLAGKQETDEACISGDCNNGYGISIANNRVNDRHQYEGRFLNGRHHGVGIIKTLTGIMVGNFEKGKLVGAYILQNNALMELHNIKGFQKPEDEFGFSLADVQKHQAISFQKFTPCTCLGRATHVAIEEYQEPYDLTDEFKNFKGTAYRTQTRRVEYPGLKNNCKGPVYIKAISNHGGFYFDKSMVVLPGQTIRKLPFNINYANAKEDIQYLGQFELAPVQNQ
jgi:hypothetical protein